MVQPTELSRQAAVSFLLLIIHCCDVDRFNAESSSLDVIRRGLSCSPALLSKSSLTHDEPKKWPLYNDVVYPPSLPNEPLRPAVSGV